MQLPSAFSSSSGGKGKRSRGDFSDQRLSLATTTNFARLSFGGYPFLSCEDEAMPEVFDGVAYGAIHTTGSITVDLRAADGSNAPGPITAPTMIKVILMDAQPLGN